MSITGDEGQMRQCWIIGCTPNPDVMIYICKGLPNWRERRRAKVGRDHCYSTTKILGTQCNIDE